MRKRLIALASGMVSGGLAALGLATAHPVPGEATYIANEGVLATFGQTKILFDPLFHNDYGQYQLVSLEDRQKIIAGEAPYDGVDMVLISHAHGDHFSAEDANALMAAQSRLVLAGPAQAIAQMKEAKGWEDIFSRRLYTIDLEIGSGRTHRIMHTAPSDTGILSPTASSINVLAVRIPHAGWPGRADVENIVYRVTLGEQVTVMHLGDADPNDAHYELYESAWAELQTDTGFPPYWFLTSETGRKILTERLRINQSVGIHVPVNAPAALEATGADFFHKPGETRSLHTHDQ